MFVRDARLTAQGTTGIGSFCPEKNDQLAIDFIGPLLTSVRNTKYI